MYIFRNSIVLTTKQWPMSIYCKHHKYAQEEQVETRICMFNEIKVGRVAMLPRDMASLLSCSTSLHFFLSE